MMRNYKNTLQIIWIICALCLLLGACSAGEMSLTVECEGAVYTLESVTLSRSRTDLFGNVSMEEAAVVLPEPVELDISGDTAVMTLNFSSEPAEFSVTDSTGVTIETSGCSLNVRVGESYTVRARWESARQTAEKIFEPIAVK